MLAIDGAKTALAVAGAGVSIAASTGARITLLHVLEPGTYDSDIAIFWAEWSEERRYEAQSKLESWARQEAGVPRAECRVAVGQPWEEVVRFATANQADLIVMGRGGETGWFGQLTVRTVERVAQHSACPVLMVGASQQGQNYGPRRVLLATDFSAVSLAAFPWADSITRLYGADLLLANVQEPMGLPGTREYARFHPEIDAIRNESDSQLEKWRRTHLAADLRVETRVIEGEPAPALCRLTEASQTDLIVMSSHGSKGWMRRWLGGTTERVLRNATCSVLVVPHRQRTTWRRGLSPVARTPVSWNTQWSAWQHLRPGVRPTRERHQKSA